MDYEDLANQSWEQIPEAKLLPAGQWVVAGRNAAFIKPKKEDQSPKVLVFFKAKQPVNVNAEDLEELGEDYDLSINDLTYTVYIETAADWDKVRKLMTNFGVELSGPLFKEGTNKLALNAAFKDAEAVATVGQRSYENDAGETIWQNTVSGFTSIED